ncbi:hydrogenase [Heliobacterium gestii]|uniref:Hydrogenase n=1 Tax=Heliomicrobium gestii TaxID=2699 RepID=A0A845LE82_HELGE|nr:nitrogenase component 1 [Heliomicrobium gestii]MBM7865603.1 nitrogenase molybdenum-iron protein beta chain [Heliomicrobium gestii]MZP41853.1 hydrogenase [Heliomicrobium gestii]
MSQFVEQIRQVCALGAMQTVLAIPRAVPILHAGPGCGQKLWSALGEYHGYQGSGYTGGHSIPCTNSGEKEVIFGGDERLREVTANTLRVIDGDLYVILTGCTADIVGDDVGEVARRFQEQGKPVVYAETGGFKGTNFYGHERVLEAIIDQYLKPVAAAASASAVEPGLVNVWSVVPYQDAFWTGNLQAIGQLLQSIGLTPNIIFGPGGGVDALRRVPKAQFNLLLSPWVGLQTVHHLEQSFGTPYFHYPIFPIGPTETGRFLRQLADYAGIAGERVEAVIAEQEAHYYYYIERSADFLFESRSGLPGRFVTIADSFYALGITRFLIQDLGMLPEVQFITDDTPPEHQQAINGYFENIAEGVRPPVVFANDGGEVREALRAIRFRERPLILGSTWDRVSARELKGYSLSVSLPISERLVLSRAYAGYDGALRLTEDIYSVILSDYQ